MGIVFVTGIDTGIGKSVATGLMARWLAQRGRTVITQKLVQTGCRGPVAEDIAVHRRLMGTGLLDVDRDGTTCPCIFAYPASPHLAARLEGRVVDIGRHRSRDGAPGGAVRARADRRCRRGAGAARRGA